MDIAKNGLTFSVFADLHYKKGMYAVTVSDMEAILNRASHYHVDFIIHAGDFSNDYIGSTELINPYLNNKYHMDAYGIYGNHELESKGNSMEVVTKLLTNDENVTWGTNDGKIGDGSIGYYYFEKNGFRIICTDTNYSYNEEQKVWEHNKTASWGAPSENLYSNSLGPKQLEWLENILTDAAEHKIPCIVFSHASFSGIWKSSPDTETVQKLFDKVNKIRPKTVIMCVNGHYHTNHIQVKNNILYFDVNTVINGYWQEKPEHHYKEEHMFTFDDYDSNGRKTDSKEISLTSLWQSKNTHYFTEPLSAIVKVSEDGTIEIIGSKTTWRYGIEPGVNDIGAMPEISSGEFVLK